MKNIFEQAGMVLFRSMDPEQAHGMALTALRSGLGAKPGPITSDRLRVKIGDLALPNPVGLAAGFDKNAVALKPLMRAGFGFLEVGAATPLAQPGNAKPRLFRLSEDRAAINRFGFNNDGMKAIVARLAERPKGIPVGLNLGANKDSANRAEDFVKVLDCARNHVDFVTVNVSSPNTENLRDLQGPMALAALLDGVMRIRRQLPVFLKIAPDLSDQDIADIAKVAEDARVSGIIATNTTLSRAGLKSAHASEAGGLSGEPLFSASTRVLAKIAGLTDIPLIGVGGVSSAAQAYAKIRAGASAVQLYTGLVYGGLSMAARIAEELDGMMARDGFASVEEARGTGRAAWV